MRYKRKRLENPFKTGDCQDMYVCMHLICSLSTNLVAVVLFQDFQEIPKRMLSNFKKILKKYILSIDSRQQVGTMIVLISYSFWNCRKILKTFPQGSASITWSIM